MAKNASDGRLLHIHGQLLRLYEIVVALCTLHMVEGGNPLLLRVRRLNDPTERSAHRQIHRRGRHEGVAIVDGVDEDRPRRRAVLFYDECVALLG